MNKLGKLSKFINSELRNFSSDQIRKIISDQDDQLNISLKQGIKITDFNERYDGVSSYVGSIKLSLDNSSLESLQSALNLSKIREINTPTLPQVELEDAQDLINENINLVEQLRGKSFSSSDLFQIDFENLKNKSSEEINMELAGARESLKQDSLEDKTKFKFDSYQDALLGVTSGRRQTSNNQQQTTLQSGAGLTVLEPIIVKSTLFFDSNDQPKKHTDFKFSTFKHYEEVNDILKYVPPNRYSENPPLDLRSVDNILKFKVNLEYNFLLKKYEQFLLEKKGLSVLSLPYFYEILEYKLRGNIPELADGDGTSFLNNPEKIISVDIRRPNLVNQVIASKIGAEQVSLEKYLNKFNPFKEQFPFYSEIKISTHNKPQNNLSDLFHEYNVYQDFLQNVLNNLIPNNFYNIENFYSSFANDDSALSSRLINLDGFLMQETFLNNLFNSGMVTDPALFFKINSKINKIKRDFKNVLMGSDSHSEVVGYVLQKYEKNSNNLLQQWVLPNVGEDYLEWIDTQIKLFEDADGVTPQQYTYRVNLLVLSVGTVYEYYNPNAPNEDPIKIENNDVTLYFRHRPTFIVFAVENSAQYTNFISDKPPIEPDINIIPYSGKDNKIKFNLNTGIGKFDAYPITKNDSEKQIIDIIRLAQDRLENDNKITFESDEPSEEFEIYRTEIKPRNYSNIFDGKLIAINTNGLSAASFDDDILPNKKYYYAARSRDYHKNYSNLTKIFEVELINDNGTIYSNIQIVDFDKDESLKQDFKSFRRYLKISPALVQKSVNTQTVSSNNIALGLSVDKVWNKNMKIRLISKQTGRKIDLKFKFNYVKIIK